MGVKAETIHQLTIPTPFLVGPVHVYLIKGETLTLVDTGPLTEEGKSSLVEQLDQLGYSLKKIEQVILTHHHPDHVGLAGLFQEHSTLIGHRYLRPWLVKDASFFRGYETFFTHFYRENGLPEAFLEKVKRSSKGYMNFIEQANIDVVVAHGDEVPGLVGWRVMEVPGHAQNHIMIVREHDRLAIGADVLLASISSNALLEAPMEGTIRPKTLLQYRRSLQLLKDEEISKMMPGHGSVIYDVNNLVDQRLQGHEKRAKAIKEILGNQSMSANDISYRLFKHKHVKQPELTFSETFGHLDFLVEREEVVMEEKNGFIFFKNE